MHREGIPLEKALERLRSTRLAVKPNDGFMRQLREIVQPHYSNRDFFTSTQLYPKSE